MTRTIRSSILLAMVLGVAMAPPLRAQVITFETIPAGPVPVDNYALGFAEAYSVGPLSITFGFDEDMNGTIETPAVIEQIGTDGTDSFLGCLGFDMASTGYATQLGNFFLRGRPGGGFGYLVIDYSGGSVSGASGEIWDIDGLTNGTERYKIKAYATGGVLLGTIDSPLSTQDSGCLNTELDGRPWTFAFSGLPGIVRITVEFSGSKTNGVGLAFNNFNATGEQPVPARTRSWGSLKRLYR